MGQPHFLQLRAVCSHGPKTFSSSYPLDSSFRVSLYMLCGSVRRTWIMKSMFVAIVLGAVAFVSSEQPTLDRELRDLEKGKSNKSPVVVATCGSDIDGDLDAMVQLTPKLSFHWTLNQDIDPPTMSALLHFEGEAWTGFGLSPTGKMIGSTAIIGYPDSGLVQKYALKEKIVSGIVPLSKAQTLTETSITQEGGTTQLRFTKLLTDSSDEPVITTDELTTFIFAAGASNAVGYHKHRGSFRINLETCQTESGWTHMGLFAAHGTLAVLAWGIATPFAMTVAWFRTLVPSSWIYIHVFSNVISLCFTFLAVILAISGVSVENSGSHFDHPHHWIGLILLIFMIFQIAKGFTRPPVERKDAYDPNQYEHDDRLIKLPDSPRKRWHLGHQILGIGMLCMGLYEITSGLSLFAENFNASSAAPWFWLYVAMFALLLLSLKAWMVLEEHKARRIMEENMMGINRGGQEQDGSADSDDVDLVQVALDRSTEMS